MIFTMFFIQLCLLFAVLSHHFATATNCQARATRLHTSIFTPHNPVYIESYEIALTRDGKQVGYTKEQDPCTKQTGITSQLPVVFLFTGTCDVDDFEECHGAYGDQTHLVGNKPTSKIKFTGLSETVNGTCTIDFNC